MNKNTKVAIVIIGLPLGIFLIAAYKKIAPQSKPRLAPVASVDRNYLSDESPTPPPTILQVNKLSDDLPTFTSPTNDVETDSPTPEFLKEPFTVGTPLLDPPSAGLLPPPVIDESVDDEANAVVPATSIQVDPLSLDPPLNSTLSEPKLLPNDDITLQQEKAAQPPPRKQVTRANDSFWLISKRSYSNGQYYRALYEHNRRKFPQPDKLAVGIEIDVPSLDELRDRYPSLCPALSGLKK